jgi:hypothetical protein
MCIHRNPGAGEYMCLLLPFVRYTREIRKPSFLPEMTISKSMARAGFKVSFERIGSLVNGKLYSHDESPWRKFPGMWRFPKVVFFNPFFQIACNANILLFWMRNALKKINVFHDSPSFL